MNLRIAPFVGVRLSTSGVRASVGPRAARLHVGTGRPAVSSGFGPFTASAALGGRRAPARRTSAGGGKATSSQALATGGAFLVGLSLAASVADILSDVMESKEATKAAEDSKRAAELLTNLHLEDFPPPARPVAPEFEPVTRKWSNLWMINEEAAAAKEADHAAARATYQRELARWKRLRNHDPMEVIATVDEALADNMSQSACVDAGTADLGNYVTLVVHYPGLEVVDGVIKKNGKLVGRPERDKIELYRRAVASTVVASAKEALACAPAAIEAYVVVLRYDLGGWRTKGVSTLDAIYAGALDRSVLKQDWSDTEPFEVISSARAVRMKLDRKGALQPLGKAAGDDIRSLIATVIEQTQVAGGE